MRTLNNSKNNIKNSNYHRQNNVKKYFEYLFKYSPLGIVILNNEEKIVKVNSAFEKIFGYKHYEVIGKIIDPLITDNSLEKEAISISHEILKNRIVTKETIRLRKNKTKVNVDITGYPIIEKGKVLGIFGIYNDITDRKISEQHLKESEKKFRIAFDTSPDSITLTKMSDNTIIEVNKSFCRITGYSKEEAIGKTTEELNLWKDFSVRKYIVNKILIEGSVNNIEVEFNKKDGTIITGLYSANILQIKGEIILLAVVKNISEYKSAQKNILENEKKYKSIFELSPEVIVLLNMRGIITDANNKITEILGYSKKEIIGKHFLKLPLHPETEKVAKEKYRSRLKGTEILSYDLKFYTKSGKIVIGNVRSTLLTNENKRDEQILLMIEDVTEKRIAEEKLKENEKKFSGLFQNSSQGIILHDLKGNILDVNKKASKLLDYTKTELTKLTIYDLEPFEKVSSNSLIGTTIAKKNITAEIMFKKKNGEIFPAELSASLLEISGKKYIQSIFRDISKRKQTEEMNLLLGNALKSINDAISITNKDEKLIFVNDVFLKMYGYSREEVIGKTIGFTRPSSEYDKDQDEIHRETSQGGWSGELINAKKDGTKFYIYLTTSVVKDNAGIPIAYIGVAKDITMQKITENKLRENEERLRSLYDNLSIGLYRSSLDGKILFANPALIKLLGYSNFNELSGISASSVYCKKERRLEFIEKINQKGEVKGFESRLRRKDGTELYIQESARPIKNSNGKILYFEGTVEDITHRKEAEQEIIKAKEMAEKSDRLKSEFLAQISHEIRTPINAILSFSSLIEADLHNVVSDDLKTSFDIIARAGNRIIRTIDLLLNMSEIQTGTYDFIPKKIDLFDDVIQKLYYEFKPVAKNKSLEFKINQPKGHFIVKKDSYSIEQIFSNLIDNAIKFTEKGTIEISINEDSGNVIVEIIDSGIGISKKYLKDLFEPFSQEEHGYTRKYEGNGLGLALVKKYCDMNDADIFVESKKGVGTTFKVIFKL